MESLTVKDVLIDTIIEKIHSIPILVSNVDDEMIRKYTCDGSFSVKTNTWSNNDSVRPTRKQNLLIASGGLIEFQKSNFLLEN